jgi:hypothetical protein
MELHTTFELLRESGVFREGFYKIAEALGGSALSEDTPISLLKILDAKDGGVDSVMWALRAVPEEQVPAADRLGRAFACRAIRETPAAGGGTVWDLLTDERSRRVVEVAEAYLAGAATEQDLDAAGDIANAAAGVDAGYAARATGAAARAAAKTAGDINFIQGAISSAIAAARWDAGPGAEKSAMDAAHAAQEQILRQHD